MGMNHESEDNMTTHTTPMPKQFNINALLNFCLANPQDIGDCAGLTDAEVEQTEKYLRHCVNTYPALVEALEAFRNAVKNEWYRKALESVEGARLFNAYELAGKALALAKKEAL